MRKTYLAIICLIISIAAFVWAVGVGSDLFRSPAFSAFWWISYYDAHAAMFFALSLFGIALVGAEYFWLWRERKPVEEIAL